MRGVSDQRRSDGKIIRSSSDSTVAKVKPFTFRKPVVTSARNPYELYLWVPELPPIFANGSHGHWSVKYRKVSALRGKTSFLVMEHAPAKSLERAKLTLVRYGSKEPDFDNLVSSFKPIIDGLVSAGIIVNDKQANIGQPQYLFVKAKRDEGAFSVKVEEIDG